MKKARNRCERSTFLVENSTIKGTEFSDKLRREGISLRITKLFFAALLFFAVYCMDDPSLVFPENEEWCSIYGRIEPPMPGTTVYLKNSDTVIDSFEYKYNDVHFRFNEVAYGSYDIHAFDTMGNWDRRFLVVDERIVDAGSLYLNRSSNSFGGFTLSNQDPVPSSVYNSHLDTLLRIGVRFENRMDTSATAAAISFNPSVSFEIRNWDYNTRHSADILIPISDLIENESLSVKIDTTARTVGGATPMLPIRRTYHLNRSFMKQRLVGRYLRSTTPLDSSNSVIPGKSIVFTFESTMDRQSIERRFSMTPSCGIPNYFWESDYGKVQKFKVFFSEGMRGNTRYSASIDSGAVTQDGTRIPFPLDISFKTAAFGFDSYTPLNGESCVGLRAQFIYNTNFEVDTASFARAFSITPPVDSLVFESGNSDNQITVSHAQLKPSTRSTITIDTLFTGIKGARIAQPLIQEFTTAGISEPVGAARHLNMHFPSYEENSRFSTSEYIVFGINKRVQPASLLDGIYIQPNVLFSASVSDPLSFSEYVTVSINFAHLLRSDTEYRIFIDSGVVTNDKLFAFGRDSLSFTTKRFVLTDVSPYDGQISISTSPELRMQFTSQVDTTNFLNRITIIPSPTAIDSPLVEYRNSYGKNGISVKGPVLKPNTRYSVSLDSAVTDAFGVPLARPYTLTFTTRGD